MMRFYFDGMSFMSCLVQSEMQLVDLQDCLKFLLLSQKWKLWGFLGIFRGQRSVNEGNVYKNLEKKI
jgi:hypothetical protein